MDPGQILESLRGRMSDRQCWRFVAACHRRVLPFLDRRSEPWRVKEEAVALLERLVEGAATEEEVVVLWRQRGLSPTGARFDGPVLGLYRVRDDKLARAQMFYFDTTALAGFLAYATDQAVASS